MMNVYLDHNATTPVDSEVQKYIQSLALDWGNPSSVHAHGRRPKLVIRQARKVLSNYLKIHPLEIIFTSGGSESNNSAIFSVFCKEWLEKNNKSAEFITTQVEHPSVSKVFDLIESYGAIVHRVPVHHSGKFDWDFFESKINSNTVLVSVMYANNETGVILPVQKICEKAHEFGALMHTDAVQALGKVEFDLKQLNVDFASFSAHKVYSLKGCGVLYVKTGTPFKSLIVGGAQERSRRAGTENTLSIASFGKSIESIKDISSKFLTIEKLRNNFEQMVISEISQSQIVGKETRRLPNTTNIIFDNIDGESLLMNLDLKGISVSTGAACSSGSSEPSPVLIAMGLTRSQAQSSLRVSLGVGTTEQDMTYFLESLKLIVSRLRKIKEESKHV